MTAVRDARPQDLSSVATALAHAFHDDPVMTYLMPREAGRPKRMASFFQQSAKQTLHTGRVITTDTETAHGGAIWSAPGKWKLGGLELVKQAPMVLSFGRYVPRALALLGRMEKVHPREEHWYLAVLGTDPAYQGTGVGSSLVQPVLDRCDAEGMGAYLESSKEANIPFYRRHGFEVSSTIAIDGGPTLWPMWRDPR